MLDKSGPDLPRWAREDPCYRVAECSRCLRFAQNRGYWMRLHQVNHSGIGSGFAWDASVWTQLRVVITAFACIVPEELRSSCHRFRIRSVLRFRDRAVDIDFARSLRGVGAWSLHVSGSLLNFYLYIAGVIYLRWLFLNLNLKRKRRAAKTTPSASGSSVTHRPPLLPPMSLRRLRFWEAASPGTRMFGRSCAL